MKKGRLSAPSKPPWLRAWQWTRVKSGRELQSRVESWNWKGDVGQEGLTETRRKKHLSLSYGLQASPLPYLEDLVVTHMSLIVMAVSAISLFLLTKTFPFFFHRPVVRCKRPDNVLNSTNALTSGRSFDTTFDCGSTIVYSCDEGHVRTSGNLTRTCEDNMMFSGERPFCAGEGKESCHFYFVTLDVQFMRISLLVNSIFEVLTLWGRKRNRRRTRKWKAKIAVVPLLLLGFCSEGKNFQPTLTVGLDIKIEVWPSESPTFIRC